MKKWLKKLAIVLTLLIVSFGLVVYFSFFGFPWTKWSTVQEIKQYLHETYTEEMVVKRGTFNFKDGKYGALVQLKNDPDVSFIVEQSYREGEQFVDYYPEALWKQQAKDDVEPLVKQVYPSPERFSILMVHGISHEMEFNREQIPHYREVEQVRDFLLLHIQLKESFDTENKEKEFEKVFQLIEQLKKKDLGWIGLTIRYKNDEDTKEDPGVYIEVGEMESVKSVSDVQHFVRDID